MLSYWPIAATKPSYRRPPCNGQDATGTRHLIPNHSVAMPRNEKNPTTSVTVVTNTPEEIAGSATEAVEHERHQNAAECPATRLQIMARPITTPRSGTLN